MRYIAVAFAASIFTMLATAAQAVQPGLSQIRVTSTVVFEGKTQIKTVLTNEPSFIGSIGSSILICTKIGGGPFVNTAKQCHGTYRFAHGNLEVSGVISSRSFYKLSVTGGTGFYSNVGAGELVVITTDLNPRQERLNFALYAI